MALASTSAQIAKDKGNTSFKAGDFADAVGHYSAAIVADRTDPTYPLNRAAAYLKLGKYHDAERDCTTVLSLDGKKVKAFFRRAQARAALERFSEAEKDLSEALQLDPLNSSLRRELVVVKNRHEETAKIQLSSKKKPMTVPSPPPSKSIAKHDTLPPKHITRSVPIEIVEGDDPLQVAETGGLLKPVKSRVVSSLRLQSPPGSTSTLSTTLPPNKPRVGAAIFRADGGQTIIRDPASITVPISPKHSSPGLAPAQVTDPTRSLSSPSPLTHFTFSRAWYALSTAHERYTLLCCIPPESLSALFQTSLEPSLLMSIVHAFSVVISSTTTSVIAQYMKAFPLVPRFATIVLFLSAEEKAAVRRMWELLDNGYDAGRRAWGV